MNENVTKLIQEFLRIRNLGFVKSLRGGKLGIGYTFETLLGKNEDRKYTPDYYGIELKTKLGYTKSALTLFTLSPKMEDESCSKYLLYNFGWPNPKNRFFKCLSACLYLNKKTKLGLKNYCELLLDEENDRLTLNIYDLSNNLTNNNIIWNISEIQNRLITKLDYLAIIKGYPYNRDDDIYFKYTNLSIYRLRAFDKFLNLLKENKIYLKINIDIYLDDKHFGLVQDHGTAFKLELENIEDLFTKIY